MTSYGEPSVGGIMGATAIKPVERHGFEAIRYFLYDTDHGTIMGRTPMSWAKITVFYLIYYTFLAGFWAACMLVFFTTVDDHVPKYTQTGSLIGRSGALGLRPMQDDKFIDSSMIMFNQALEETKENLTISGWREWSKRSNEFLQLYRNDTKGIQCSETKQPNSDQFCKFDVKSLGPCGRPPYGYNMGRPCVFLKLNKIYGLVPDFYNDVNSLPDGFPDRLKELMTNMNKSSLDQVWVDCHPEHAADKEGLGAIEYYPRSSGFPSIHYPFLNQDGYLAPLVAVQFLNPTPGQLLHVECQAWAENIGYNRRDKIGIVRFELMVHNKATAHAVDES